MPQLPIGAARGHTGDAIAGSMNPAHRPAGQDFPATRAHPPRHFFPELSWAQLRIQKFLDQRSLRILLANILRLSARQLLQPVCQRLTERDAFDSLRSPLCANFIARHAPDFLRVAFEKCQIQVAAEPVDEKVLERPLRLDGPRRGHNVADPRAGGSYQTKLAKRSEVQRERVFEKLP